MPLTYVSWIKSMRLVPPAEMPLSSAKKSSEKVHKFGQNGLKQAENQWKYPNLGIKKNLISD